MVFHYKPSGYWGSPVSIHINPWISLGYPKVPANHRFHAMQLVHHRQPELSVPFGRAQIPYPLENGFPRYLDEVAWEYHPIHRVL